MTGSAKYVVGHVTLDDVLTAGECVRDVIADSLKKPAFLAHVSAVVETITNAGEPGVYDPTAANAEISDLLVRAIAEASVFRFVMRCLGDGDEVET